MFLPEHYKQTDPHKLIASKETAEKNFEYCLERTGVQPVLPDTSRAWPST